MIVNKSCLVTAVLTVLFEAECPHYINKSMLTIYNSSIQMHLRHFKAF